MVKYLSMHDTVEYCMANEKPIKKEISGVAENIKEAISAPNFTNGLAIILIIGSIIAILVLISIHMTTVNSNQSLYKDVFLNVTNLREVNATPEQLFNSFQNFYRETNASNMNLLSILLPVIGAWIGAILAFYYGNKNLEKLSENYDKTVQAIQGSSAENEKLGKIKVKEVLEAFPSYKTVNSGKISESVGPKVKALGKFSTLLLTDDTSKPLGFLSLNDVSNSSPITRVDLEKETKSFVDFFTQMHNDGRPIIDEITSKEWSDKGIANYAEISLEDTLQAARDKIKAISEKQSTRGLVLDNNKKILGLITMDLFSKVMVEF